MHTKDLGTLGEVLVIACLLEHGYSVYNSVGDNNRADVIAENDKGEVFKIQVKTKNREASNPDSTILYLRKTGPNGYVFKYKEFNLDYFALVDLDTRKIAWISNEILTKNSHTFQLKHSISKNGQKTRVKYFDDYTKIPF